MSQFELAQLNIAAAKGEMDSPVMADFVASLERINALAESAPGYVWRHTSEADATSTTGLPCAPNTLINLSVWRDVEALRDFAFRSEHADMMRRRREWFDRMEEDYLVLWWVPAGHQPSIDEAMERLEMLRTRGATADAFTFRNAYPPPGELAPT